MSGGCSCQCAGTRDEKRKFWVVTDRECNHSAFNGYHWTPSDYSRIECSRCGRAWRSKAKYVDSLPDAGTLPALGNECSPESVSKSG